MASRNPNPTDPGLPHTDTPTSPQHKYYMNGKVIITAGIILVIIVFFILAFHVYARVFWRRRRPLRSWRRNQGSHDRPSTGGLDKAVVNSLPTFTYTLPLLHEGGNVTSEEAGAGVVECAVCLIEFQENDACRLLPKCNHSFHTECIDMWFLSNTTCPLCRTSAEPVDSDVVHHAETSTAFFGPHQDLGEDHVLRRSNSSPSDCLLPHQDSNSHIQRQDIDNHMQRSSSPLGGDFEEGAGLHVRRMLARTCSSRADTRYDLVGEDMHNDTMSESMNVDRNGNVGRDRAQGPFGRHLHLPNWQRSVSDKSLNARQGMQFPSNVLFWGNHAHVDSRFHTDHWQVGGRSLPHITIDVPRLQDSFLTPCAASRSPSQCFLTGERPRVQSSSVQHQPSRMN